VGPITADAAVATVIQASEFKNAGRWRPGLGTHPTFQRWACAIGRPQLSRRPCLRTLLIQGARSSLQRAKAVATEKATPEQLWIRSLAARLSFGKVLVAIANKHARQLWVMLAHDADYDPHACLARPMHRQAGAA
jgi:hypothetical protein